MTNDQAPRTKSGGPSPPASPVGVLGAWNLDLDWLLKIGSWSFGFLGSVSCRAGADGLSCKFPAKAQASGPCYRQITGQTPVLRRVHKRDACATEKPQAKACATVKDSGS